MFFISALFQTNFPPLYHFGFINKFEHKSIKSNTALECLQNFQLLPIIQKQERLAVNVNGSTFYNGHIPQINLGPIFELKWYKTLL